MLIVPKNAWVLNLFILAAESHQSSARCVRQFIDCRFFLELKPMPIGMNSFKNISLVLLSKI